MAKYEIFLKKNKIIIFFSIFILFICVFFLFDFLIHSIIEKKRIKKMGIHNEIITKNPVYAYTFKKNYEVVREHNGKKYKTITNSLGFKSKKKITIKKELNKKRIIFIGDSFTEGVTINYEDTFVGLIDEKFANKNIQVLNAGVEGYSTIIYYKKIKHLIEVEKIKFDELVVFIDISDAQDDALKYSLNPSGNVIKQKKIIYKTKKSLLKTIKDFIYNNTYFTYNILDFAYDTILNLKFKGNTWREVYDVSATPIDKWTIDDALYDDYGKKGVSLMIKYMNELKKITDKYNITLTVAVYPWISQIWYEDLDSKHVKIWREWTKNNDVKFINFFPLFVKKNISQKEKIDIFKLYFIPGDVHFNEYGNKIIADYFFIKY